jgi:transposase-like protein
MAATRLSDSQKQELIARFRGGASIQQLAIQYGCSPTTVSRTAKAAMDQADYEGLLKQQKAQRSGAGPGETANEAHHHLGVQDDADDAQSLGEPSIRPGDAEASEPLEHENPESDLTSAPTGSDRLADPRTPAGSDSVGDVLEPQAPSPHDAHAAVVGSTQEPVVSDQGALDPAITADLAQESAEQSAPVADGRSLPPQSAAPQRILGRRRRSGAAVMATPAPLDAAGTEAADLSKNASAAAHLSAGLADTPESTTNLPEGLTSAPSPTELISDASLRHLAIDDADDFGADDNDDDLSHDDLNSDDLNDDSAEEIVLNQGETFVAIPVGPFIDDLVVHEAVPFNAAALPASAFLLVDKTVELQGRPLRELPELGRLADDELDRQALVLFVNPRQAKRQCGRTQRVIPLPDPSLLERAAPYLVAQGITRLVIEGALYALPGG